MEEEIEDWIGLNHLPPSSGSKEVSWFRSVSIQSQKLLLLVWPELLTPGILQFAITGGYLGGVPGFTFI